MKKLLIILFVLAVYVGCVVWITWGLNLGPSEKYLICAGGIIAASVGNLLAESDRKD